MSIVEAGMSYSEPRFGELLMKSIKQAITKEIEGLVELAVKEAQAELARRIPQIVAGVALGVAHHLDCQTMSDRFIITLKMPT